MEQISLTFIKNRVKKAEKNNSRIYSKVQYEAAEVYGMVDKAINFGILLGLAKRKPAIFERAKIKLYADLQDGLMFRNKASYFMWLIGHYGKQINK